MKPHLVHRQTIINVVLYILFFLLFLLNIYLSRVFDLEIQEHERLAFFIGLLGYFLGLISYLNKHQKSVKSKSLFNAIHTCLLITSITLFTLAIYNKIT